MADELSSVVGRLNLTGEQTESSRPHSERPKSDAVKALEKQKQRLDAAAKNARDIGVFLKNEPTIFKEQEIAELTSLTRKANHLAITIRNSTKDCIIAHLKSYAMGQRRVLELLTHLNIPLRDIIQQVLHSATGESDVLRQVLEKCYTECRHANGALSTETESNKDDEWIRFWVHALSQCPNGPTLFYPPAASQDVWCSLEDVPRYLFRAFDEGSSGKSNEVVVASHQNISAKARDRSSSKVDLLSLKKKEAAEMLYKHLDKKSGPYIAESDNLMSWSSSLLFVIQSAIWMRQKGRPPSKVKICAVDTGKFPTGQFARDKSLLKAYHDTLGLSEETQEIEKTLFYYRFGNSGLDNGEYLSQGLLTHAGRSCVVSLEKLIDAGLCVLYSKFGEPSDGWTKRVRRLRSDWFYEKETTMDDINRATEVARTCFSELDEIDLAVLLLLFKNRSLRPTATRGQGNETKRPDYGPDEVCRYMDVLEAMPRDRTDDPVAWLSANIFDVSSLRRVVICDE